VRCVEAPPIICEAERCTAGAAERVGAQCRLPRDAVGRFRLESRNAEQDDNDDTGTDDAVKGRLGS
jgi:hypothetical protein